MGRSIGVVPGGPGLAVFVVCCNWDCSRNVRSCCLKGDVVSFYDGRY